MYPMGHSFNEGALRIQQVHADSAVFYQECLKYQRIIHEQFLTWFKKLTELDAKIDARNKAQKKHQHYDEKLMKLKSN